MIINMSPIELWREKESDLTQSYMYDKSLYTHIKPEKAKWHHKYATKNFDYTTIAGTNLGRSVGVTTATQLL